MRALATIAVPAVAGVALIGGAGQASAADHPTTPGDQTTSTQAKHYGPDARVRKARHDARRAAAKAARKAARAAGQTPGSTPTSTSTGTGHRAPGSPIPGTPNPAADCQVTAERPPAGSTAWTIHNGCPTPQTLTIHVQTQPGPWRDGLCKEHPGACHLVVNRDVTVPAGTSTLTIDIRACGDGQVDLVWADAHGVKHRIKSGHYSAGKCQPPPATGHGHPPVTTPGKPKPPAAHARHDGPGHPTYGPPVTELAHTGGIPWTLVKIAGGGIGGGVVVLLFGIGGAETRRTRAMRRSIAQTATVQ